MKKPNTSFVRLCVCVCHFFAASILVGKAEKRKSATQNQKKQNHACSSPYNARASESMAETATPRNVLPGVSKETLAHFLRAS